MPCLAQLSHSSLSDHGTDAALQGDRRLRHEGALLGDTAPRQEATDEFVDLHRDDVQLPELVARDHPHGTSLDCDRGLVFPQGRPDDVPTGKPLDLRGRRVQSDAADVVGAPPRLDHRGANPSGRHPTFVFPAVLVVGSPMPLDALGSHLSNVLVLNLAHLRRFHARHDLVTVVRRVRQARTPNHAGRSRRTLDLAVWPVVVSRHAHVGHWISSSVRIDDVHQGLWMVPQCLLVSRTLRDDSTDPFNGRRGVERELAVGLPRKGGHTKIPCLG
mmetsp:Transcript_13302/g.33449  ORF Transcript_13302/g.33449 Transcript_13302/m.33449 type:complete len:273 (+) Transcript_13302:1123-1941(+)